MNTQITWHCSIPGVIPEAFKFNPDPVIEKFDELMEGFVKDDNSYITHTGLFKDMMELRPEVSLYCLNLCDQRYS